MDKLHKKKFKEFIEACDHPVSRILIAQLRVIGDTPEEIETNILYAVNKGKEIYVAGTDKAYVICDHNKLNPQTGG